MCRLIIGWAFIPSLRFETPTSCGFDSDPSFNRVLSISNFSHGSALNLLKGLAESGRAQVLFSSPTMHPKSVALSQTELFQRRDDFLPWDDRVRLSYVRAKAIGKLYGA